LGDEASVRAASVRSLLAAAADEQPTIKVTGPTVIAFFPPVTKAELEKDLDLNCVLSDFQFFAAESRKAFKDTGIDFHEIYAKSFVIQIGDQKTLFRPGDGEMSVGYYFVSPGKSPRVEYGIDLDMEIAKEYFGNLGK